jgi:diguanylate cyclase (GGDEF)-like protein
VLGKEAFTDVLAQAAKRADVERSTFSLLKIRLDNLPLIRDGFGGQAQVIVMKHVSVRLMHIAGSKGKVAFDSGDKFLMLVRGNGAVSQPLARQVLKALSEPIDIHGYQHRTRASIGIAVYPEHGTDTELLSRVALAMRVALERGGNQVCLFAPTISARIQEEAMLVLDLSQAIANDELALHFQPKIDAGSMQVTSAEALLRWNHPKRGFVSPTVFIPLAEKHGLMEGIGSWVFKEACRNAAEWLKRGLRMRVAVNISPYQMQQENLVTQILSTLHYYGLEPRRFTCEITETAAMADTQATTSTFEEMFQAGLHISIDDFGTGYSSLSALRRMPAAELKIDMAFVRDIENSSEARFIAKSIIDMAKRLDLHVVAEGVETVGQSDLLVAMGCDELQGYLFSLPIPADALQSMVDDRLNTGAAEFRNSLFATDFDSIK